MSLRPGGRDHRSRSKSRGRDRSRSNVRKAPSPPEAPEPPTVAAHHELVSPSRAGDDDDDDDEEEEDGHDRRSRALPPFAMPAMPGGFDGQPSVGPPSVRSPVATPGLSNFAPPVPYPPEHGQHNQHPVHGGHHAFDPEEITMGDYKDLPPHERPSFLAQQGQHHSGSPHEFPGHPQSPPHSGLSRQFSAPSPQAMPPSPDHGRHYSQQGPYEAPYEEPQASYPTHPRTMSNANQERAQRYANLPQYQYANVPDKLTFTSKPQVRKAAEVPHTVSQPEQLWHTVPQHEPIRHTVPQPEQIRHRPQMPGHSYSASAHANVVEVTPGGFASHEEPSKHGTRARHASLRDEPGFMDQNDHHIRPFPPRNDFGALTEEHHPKKRGEHSSRLSPDHNPGLMPRMDRLSVSGNRPDMHNIMPGALPPGSPMLEAYHGTYQSISPMPSPLMMPGNHGSDSDLEDITPLSPYAPLPTPEQFATGAKRPKAGRHRSSSSVAFTNESNITTSTAKSSKKRVQLYDAESDANALISALSHRSADPGPLIDILPQLSHDQIMELRNEYKKRCKVQGRGINIAKHIKLKTSGNFGKFCYVTALGRFESEAYWANFWYQSNGSRRELLIESLMGKNNAEVRLIKESFRDKRYSDSLVRCMDKELKADKFRTAVLLALEERRQEEADVYSAEQVIRDAEKLNESLKRREGGESAMLQIVLLRSDAHLREVLRAYERRFKENFARAALKKSNNLVVSCPCNLIYPFAFFGTLVFHLRLLTKTVAGRSHCPYSQRRD